MSILFPGIIHVTGEPDSGKTTFAIECGVSPDRMVFIDADIKASAIVNELKESGNSFFEYIDLIKKIADKKENEIYDIVIKIIDDLEKKKGQFDVIVFDNWTLFENVLEPYVEANLSKFRQKWSPMGQIKGAQMWQSSFDLEAQILNRLAEISPLVILTTHLKPEVRQNVKTGRQIADCKKPLVQKTHLRIWLHLSKDSPEPIGLVLKRISKHTITKDGIKTINVLPRKLVPCTWDKIREYWNNPIGNRKPLPEELLDEYEMSVLDGILTEDQKLVLKLNLDGGNLDEEDKIPDENKFADDVVEKVRKMKEDGKSIPVISRETKLNIPDIIKILEQ
ncbi:MAG: AAA family ATPase [Spirochaetes bacterium]|nr:AAA family ATPase [Spirochaetota bacterium]